MLRQLLRAIARSVSSEVRFETLARDLSAVAPGIKASTVSRYVEVFRRLFVVETQQAWTPSLRSKGRIRTSDKLHLADPSLAAAALQATPQSLTGDLNTLGLLFESAVHHDIAVLVAPWGAGSTFPLDDGTITVPLAALRP